MQCYLDADSGGGRRADAWRGGGERWGRRVDLANCLPTECLSAVGTERVHGRLTLHSSTSSQAAGVRTPSPA